MLLLEDKRPIVPEYFFFPYKRRANGKLTMSPLAPGAEILQQTPAGVWVRLPKEEKEE